MGLYIKKFGGTSLASVERIGHVADMIIRARAAGEEVVVVVSAMAGETDRLLALAEQAAPESTDREYAQLLSTGEQVSMALLVMVLRSRGCPARGLTAAQAGICTTNDYVDTQITEIDPEAVTLSLAIGEVPVITGFQGMSESGEVTTLGRGGSDATAVALAHALNADECQIFSDVLGVHSIDPSLFPNRPCLPFIRADELLLLAQGGAKIVQPYAVELAIDYTVSMRVLSTFSSGLGTKVNFYGDPVFVGGLFGIGILPESGEKSITLSGRYAKILDSDSLVWLTIVHQSLVISDNFSSDVLNALKNKAIKVYSERAATFALSVLIEENIVRLAVSVLSVVFGVDSKVETLVLEGVTEK